MTLIRTIGTFEFFLYIIDLHCGIQVIDPRTSIRITGISVQKPGKKNARNNILSYLVKVRDYSQYREKNNTKQKI